MEQEPYSIIFSSATGNTKLLAETIHNTLPQEGCAYFGPWNREIPTSPTGEVGFWTDKGNADQNTLALLGQLRNKKVFLFGTAGFGQSPAYFEKVLGAVRSALDDSNQILGEYMCQGKMPQAVKDRYLRMKAQPEHPQNLDALIANFDHALSHPDKEDLEKLGQMVQGV